MKLFNWSNTPDPVSEQNFNTTSERIPPIDLPKFKVGEIVNLQRLTEDTEYEIVEIRDDGTMSVRVKSLEDSKRIDLKLSDYGMSPDDFNLGDYVTLEQPAEEDEYEIVEIRKEGDGDDTVKIRLASDENSKIYTVSASELLKIETSEETQKENTEIDPVPATEKNEKPVKSFENKFNSFIEKHNQKVEDRLKPNIKENKLGGIKGFLERIGKTYQGSAIHSRLISGASTTLALGASAFANTNPVAFWGLNTIRAVLSTYSGSMAGKAVVLANQERNIESKLIKNEDGTLGVDLEKLSPKEQAELLAELAGYASGKAQKIDSAAYKKSQEELSQKTEGRFEGKLNKIRETFKNLNPTSKLAIAGAVMTGNVVLTRLLGPWGAVAATGMNILYSKISTNKVDNGEFNKYSEVIEKLSNSLEGYAPAEDEDGPAKEELYKILEKQSTKVENKQKGGAWVGGLFGAVLSIWSTERAYGKSLGADGHAVTEARVVEDKGIDNNKRGGELFGLDKNADAGKPAVSSHPEVYFNSPKAEVEPLEGALDHAKGAEAPSPHSDPLDNFDAARGHKTESPAELLGLSGDNKTGGAGVSVHDAIAENHNTDKTFQPNSHNFLDNTAPQRANSESLNSILGSATKESGAPLSAADFDKLLHSQGYGIHSGFDYTKAFSGIEDSSYHSAGKISESDLKNIVLNPGKHIPSGVLDPLKEKILSGKIDMNSLKLVANKDHVGEIQLKFAEWEDGKPVLKGIVLENPKVFEGHPSINDIAEKA